MLKAKIVENRRARRTRRALLLATFTGVSAIAIAAAAIYDTPNPSPAAAASVAQANRSIRGNPGGAKWVSPLPNGELSSCYGLREGKMHQGIDLFDVAESPEFAVGAGTVLASGWNYSDYGISVIIDHHDGFFTHYAHMSKTNVNVGDEVRAGDVIGWEGTTGNATGPHLHFEVHQGLWHQIDPAPWLRERGVRIGC